MACPGGTRSNKQSGPCLHKSSDKFSNFGRVPKWTYSQPTWTQNSLFTSLQFQTLRHGLWMPWTFHGVAYAFPPTALLPKVVQKLQSQICRIILIAPGWPTKPWFWDLVEMSLDIPRQLPPIRTQTTTEQPIPCKPSFPQSPRVVSRSSTLKERGFTAEVAERIAAPQRLSTRAIYSPKMTSFSKLVHRGTGGLQESIYKWHM